MVDAFTLQRNDPFSLKSTLFGIEIIAVFATIKP